MRTLQTVMILGRVGKITIRRTSAGDPVAAVSVATDHYQKDTGEERTDWHRVICWDQNAEFVEKFVRVGDPVHVVGRLRYDSYERDGVVIPTCEVHASSFIRLVSGGGKSAGKEGTDAGK